MRGNASALTHHHRFLSKAEEHRESAQCYFKCKQIRVRTVNIEVAHVMLIYHGSGLFRIAHGLHLHVDTFIIILIYSYGDIAMILLVHIIIANVHCIC